MAGWTPGAVADPAAWADAATRGLQELMSLASSTFAPGNGQAAASPFGARPKADESADAPAPDPSEAYRAIDAWADFAKGVVERLLVPAAAEPDQRSLRVVAVPGGVTIGEWWITNLAADDIETVRPAASGVSDGNGEHAVTVRFEPDEIALPARSSRAIDVVVTVGDSVPPGTYRALVQAHPLPDAWQVIEIAVDGTPPS